MSGTNFKTRRDYSVNNVPVVGYQDGADMQDVLLWGAKQIADTGLTTDANGLLTVTKKPILDMGHVAKVDGLGVERERLLDSKSLTITGGTYYIGEVNAKEGTIKLYTDAELTTSASNRTGISVTYYTPIQVAVNAYGNLQVGLASPIPAGTNNIGDVDVVTLPALPAGGNKIGNVVEQYAGGEIKQLSDLPKYLKVIVSTSQTLWTPQAGKQIVLKGLWAQNGGRVTTWGVADTDIDFKAGSTIFAHMKLAAQMHLKDTTVAGVQATYAKTGEFGSGMIDFGDGVKLGVDQALTLISDSATSTYPTHVTAWGYEV